MDKYQYSEVPNLAKSVVDMANFDIAGRHKHSRYVDNVLITEVFDAQARVELEKLRTKHPNQYVSWNGVIGYKPEREYE